VHPNPDTMESAADSAQRSEWGTSRVQTTFDETASNVQASAVRVAVVDDHESVRLGLKAAFIEAGYDFVLAAANVDELIEGLDKREVDVVVLDLSLGDGSVVTDNVKRVQAIGSAVLVHSIADRVASVREALAAGAAGVIPKSSATSTVLQAAATVARGDVLNNLEWATAIDADRCPLLQPVAEPVVHLATEAADAHAVVRLIATRLEQLGIETFGVDLTRPQRGDRRVNRRRRM